MYDLPVTNARFPASRPSTLLHVPCLDPPARSEAGRL